MSPQQNKSFPLIDGAVLELFPPEIFFMPQVDNVGAPPKYYQILSYHLPFGTLDL